MHPSITSSQNAVELLSVHKTCVDGKKKDRDLLSEDVLVLGRLAVLMSRAGEVIRLFYFPQKTSLSTSVVKWTLSNERAGDGDLQKAVQVEEGRGGGGGGGGGGELSMQPLMEGQELAELVNGVLIGTQHLSTGTKVPNCRY